MAKAHYKDLIVWKKAVDLAEAVYIATEDFPKREHLGLAAQIRKSAVSIASNIAEGAARETNKEFKQFIVVTRGSSAELQTQMLIAARRNYITKETYVSLSAQLNEIGKMTFALRKSINVPAKRPASKLKTQESS